MSDVELNGLPVISGDLKLPYQGAGTAELVLDADEAPSGQATLSFIGRTIPCAVVEDPDDDTKKLSGDSGGFVRCLLVFGAGSLEKQLEPYEFAQGALIGDVLNKIIDGTGEQLASDIDPLLIGRVVPQWSWTTGSVRDALSALSEYLSAVWRVRADGHIWIGAPVPVEVAAPDYIIADIAPEVAQASWVLTEATVEPDQIIDGLTVRQVLYSWEQNALRAVITYAPGPVGGLFGLFALWLRRVNIDYFRVAAGRVAGQGIGTLQFQPDSSHYSALKQAGLRLGLPDSDVQGLQGGRADAAWEGAAPAGPVVFAYAPGPVATGQISKLRLGLSSAGPPAGTQPLVTRAMRTAEATKDSSLASSFIAAAVALVAAGGDPTLASLAPAAAAALVTAGNALGAGTGAAKAIQDYETTAALNSNFLTSILEGG